MLVFMNKTVNEIILIDDDYLIREVIKKVISKMDNDFKVFTSENGIEGLGLIFVQNPSLIILDTTLPKYGGMELVKYIESNKKINDKNNIPLILIHESNKVPSIDYENCIKINKKDKDFLKKLEDSVYLKLRGSTYTKKENYYERILHFLSKNIILWSNKSDLVMHKIADSNFLITIPLYIWWILTQIIVSLFFVLYYLLSGGNARDNNTNQHKADLAKYRVRYYPTLVGFFAGVLLILVQVSVFIIGGITVKLSFTIKSFGDYESDSCNTR